MESTQSKQRVNPLTSLMRQPKIYIKLPSGGKFWALNSLDVSPSEEYAVYSMTARDELLLKTPDALMNGQAVVDVIQNCIPAIKNAWEVPSIDLDVILIAMRLATYGEMMEASLKIGEEDMHYNVDLRKLLDSLYETITWEERINVGTELALYIKPVNYSLISQTSIQNFETQKLMSLVNNSELTEEQKIDTFRESFQKLTNITVGIINSSVYRIESSQGTTEIPEDIEEFMNNCDKSIYDAVRDRLEKLKLSNTLKPIRVKASLEMIANGADEEIEVPLTFDPANFFG